MPSSIQVEDESRLVGFSPSQEQISEGKMVRWGGVIDVVFDSKGVRYIEIIEHPIMTKGMPDFRAPSGGKFV